MTFQQLQHTVIGSGLALHVTQAQQPGIKRTDVQRHDLGVPRTAEARHAKVARSSRCFLSAVGAHRPGVNPPE